MNRIKEEKPNNILLFTIYNPAYPITVDVIHKICCGHGNVLRIVVFKKNGVQAMVEFDSIESADRTRNALQGCDIYQGCCTLKIDFSKTKRLNVYKNNSESFDYTEVPLMDDCITNGRPILNPPNHFGPPPSYSHSGAYGAPPDHVQGTGGGIPGSVLMVYGMNVQEMNCDKLFNLFCLYGNVEKIKFLKSKEGSAMVQMADAESVERIITSLNRMMIFGYPLQLGFSKQTMLHEMKTPFELSDGTLSFKDYSCSRNNRFTNSDMASKNRSNRHLTGPPTDVLHYFNAPPGLSDADIYDLFDSSYRPNSVTIFPPKSERSSSGLLFYQNAQLATEALIRYNHLQIDNQGGKFPYIFKLSFSSSRSI